MSALAQRADEYLALRRALGHDLADAHRLLPRLIAFLDANDVQTLTIDAALTWTHLPKADPGSSVWPRRLTVARGFARFMSGIDAATEIPPVGLLPFRARRRIPYLFSAQDLSALLAATRRIPTSLRAATYETLLGLLAATGMRVGEALRLDRSDIDWDEGALVIRKSKFGKSRELPLHASTVDALARYARHRDQHGPRSQASTFFVSIVGTPLIYADVGWTFRGLLQATGIGDGSSIRPRIHDLRHGFAVATLITWYRDGEDVRARLPLLSTYLGHSEPRNTYRYLSTTPELLAFAADRLERAHQP